MANIILDDIIDSGKTMAIYKSKYPGKQYWAVVDKQKANTWQDKWIVFPWENDHPAGEDTIQQNIVRQLQYIGENPAREGLIDTPNRVVKSWSKLFEGYNKKPEDILTVFSSDGYNEIVLLKDVEMYSLCEHHMLPFFGKAHIAYIPGKEHKKIVGISKLARLVDIFARRLQIQERIGDQVTDVLMTLLQADGAACIIEAKHMCMCMRGVEKQNSIMTTSSLKGAFMTNPEARQELMQLIK
jgi:GTP cyclohydrolase I